MSYVTSWERFAREEGLHEGEKRGMAKVLLHQFQAKFGPPTPEVIKLVQDAKLAQLEDWLTRILTSSTFDEVFTPR